MNITEHSGITVVALEEDRLDAAMAVQFKDGMREIADAGASHIILDMGRVGFMDSSGLGAVVAVMKHVGREKVFEISALTPTVEKVFKLTRMDSVFRIHASTDSALSEAIKEAG
jgi:anti-sigma B factor antagonist